MIITLSDIKKILDYYDSHSSWLDKIFFPEDRPIAYIRKHYEVLSQYHSQDKILEYDRDSLRYVFKRICSTSVFPEDEPLYSTIGQFQKLFGLCEDGKPYKYKLNILYGTVLNTDRNWNRLYEQRAHLAKISRGLREYFKLVKMAPSQLEVKQRDFVAICEAGPHAVQMARGLCVLRLGRCYADHHVAFLKEHASQAAERAKELALCWLGVTREQFIDHVSAIQSDDDAHRRIMHAKEMRRINRSKWLSLFAICALFAIAGTVTIVLGLIFAEVALPLILCGVGLFLSGAVNALIIFNQSRPLLATSPPNSSAMKPFYLALKVFEGYQLFPERFGVNRKTDGDNLSALMDEPVVTQEHQPANIQPITASIGWREVVKRLMDYCALPRRASPEKSYQLTGEYQLLLREEELAQCEYEELLKDVMQGVKGAAEYQGVITDSIKRAGKDDDVSIDESIFSPLTQQSSELADFIEGECCYVFPEDENQADYEISDFINGKVCYVFPTAAEEPNIERRIAEIKVRTLMLKDAAHALIRNIEADIEQDITEHSSLFPAHIARRQQRAIEINRLFSRSHSNKKVVALSSDTTFQKRAAP